jgi:hypothetical protein
MSSIIFRLLLPLLLSLFLFGIGFSNEVSIGSVSAFPTGKAVLPVNFQNDIELSAVTLVIKFDTSMIVIDSFSTVGSRVEYIDLDDIIFDDSANLAILWIPDFVDYIPIGNGLLCNLFFGVKPKAAGHTVVVDSAYWPILPPADPKRVLFTTAPPETETIYPDFIEGYITVLDAPPTHDSIIVDSVGTGAGEQVAVTVYGSNEEDIASIDISLTYSSDFLIYSSTEFGGSRGESAQQTIENSPSNRQIHIELDYGESTPLTPGNGTLATLIFDIPVSATDELVTIDSISYLTVQPMQFHQTTTAGGITFAPYFIEGYVNIKTTTPVEEDDPAVLPLDFALRQNVPNPFNPRTKIDFDLPRSSFVRLDVLNILGRKVRSLINEELSAGKHSIIFDALSDDGNALASGVYFYRLEAGDFIQSRKMMLLK